MLKDSAEAELSDAVRRAMLRSGCERVDDGAAEYRSHAKEGVSPQPTISDRRCFGRPAARTRRIRRPPFS